MRKSAIKRAPPIEPSMMAMVSLRFFSSEALLLLSLPTGADELGTGVEDGVGVAVVVEGGVGVGVAVVVGVGVGVVAVVVGVGVVAVVVVGVVVAMVVEGGTALVGKSVVALGGATVGLGPARVRRNERTNTTKKKHTNTRPTRSLISAHQEKYRRKRSAARIGGDKADGGPHAIGGGEEMDSTWRTAACKLEGFGG